LGAKRLACNCAVKALGSGSEKGACKVVVWRGNNGIIIF
jgi:hypothetical protein